MSMICGKILHPFVKFHNKRTLHTMHYTTNEDFKLARSDLEKSLTDVSEYSRKQKPNLNANKTEFIALCKKSKKA